MGVFEHFPYTNFHDMNDGWVLKIVKECSEAVESLEDWKAQHQEEYQELKDFMDDLKAGDFPPSMYAAMRTWLENNALELVGQMVKFITVEVNDLGYFVIKIPEQWSDIYFRTTGYDIPDILGVDYGHLAIGY